MDARTGTGHWRLTYDDDGHLIAVELWDILKSGDMVEYEAYGITSVSKSAFPASARKAKK